jgi:hypothetical protein
MTLSTNAHLSEHETVADWVSATAEETDVAEAILWDIASKLLLEPNTTAAFETEMRLKILYEIHLNRWDGTENPPASWVKLTVPTDHGLVDTFQFSFGMFNVPVDDIDERIEAMKQLTRDEGIEVEVNDPAVIATSRRKCHPVWALRVTERILNEVYDVGFADVQAAEEEVSGGPNITWDETVKFR